MNKTSELIGPALDWAVASCEDFEIFISNGKPWVTPNGGEDGRLALYSTNWAQGGPIIERENISLERNVRLRGCSVAGFYDWWAHHPKNYGGLIRYSGTGPTPLIAAMRCYVASKLGEEVNIPKELL